MSYELELQQTLYNSTNPTRQWLHVSRRNWILNAINRVDTKIENAIEIGPGSGVYLPALAAKYQNVVAADIEDAFLENARKLTSKHSNITTQKIDITEPQTDSDCFDLILCSEVIEHITDSPAALAQMRQLIRPDGLLVLSTPHRWSTLEIAARLAFKPGFIQLARKVYREPIFESGHINLLTRGALEQQLHEAGFELLERSVTGFYLPGIAEFTGRYGLAIEKRLAGWLEGSPFEQLMWTQCYVCRPMLASQPHVESINRDDFGRFLRFCITGGMTSVIYFSVIYTLFWLWQTNPTLASAISFVPAIIYNYISHKIWSFESDGSHQASLPRFALVTGCGMAINSGTIFLGTEVLAAPFLPVQLVAISIVLIWNYIWFSRWVFPKV